MFGRLIVVLTVPFLCAHGLASQIDENYLDSGVPHLEVERDRPSKALVRTKMTLERGVACKRCEGKGKVDEKRRTVRTGFTDVQSRTVQVECKTCKGQRVQSTQAIERTLRDVFETLAAVREEEDTEARFDALADGFREDVLPLAGALGPRMREMLRAIDRADPEQRIGKPFLVTSGTLSKLGEDLYVIKGSLKEATYVISNPRIVRALQGENVVSGGLIVGTHRVGNKDLLVLEHGVIIAE